MTGGTYKLTSQLVLDLQKRIPNSGISLANTQRFRAVQELPFGTGPGTASVVALVKFGLAPGGAQTVDLYDGSILDPYGDPAAFRLVRGWAFWVSSGGDDGGVKITGGASNPLGLDWVGTPGTSTGQIVYPDCPAAGGRGSSVTSTARTLTATNLGAVYAEAQLYLAGTRTLSGGATGNVGLTYP